MSKLPLEDKEKGIHRAKIWEIGFYACNNLSTNLYMLLMGSISYYLIGIVGLGAVLAGSIGTIIVVLIWLYMSAIVLIMGAELNGTLMSLRKEKLGR